MRIELKTDTDNRVMLRIVAENDAERFILSTFHRQIGEESLIVADAAPVLAIGPNFLTFGTKPFPAVKLPGSLTADQRQQVLEAIDVQTIAGQQELKSSDLLHLVDMAQKYTQIHARKEQPTSAGI